jgi:hypothetical protein
MLVPGKKGESVEYVIHSLERKRDVSLAFSDSSPPNLSPLKGEGRVRVIT